MKTIIGLGRRKIEKEFVTYKGKKYYVEEDTLRLNYLDITDITEIEGLENLETLSYLSLYKNQITEVKGLEHLTNLQRIDLSNNKVQEIERLENLPNLCLLELRYNEIKEITQIKGLERLTHLQKLDLRWNQIEEITGLETLTNLKEIELWGNPIRVDERHMVFGRTGWEKDVVYELHEIYLVSGIDFRNSTYTIVSRGAQELVRYCQDKKAGRISFVTVGLTRYYVANDLLNLSKIGITEISEIKGLEQLTNLKKLYLFGNQIKELKGVEKLTNLQTLHLGGNQITELKGLEQLTNLKSLNLKDNQIEEIQGLEYLTSLQELDLDKNPIKTPIGTMKARELVEYCQEKVGTFPAVKVDGKKHYVVNDTLNLNNLGINEITEIQGLENFISLQKLHLERNQITEIKGLEQFINLRELDLRSNQIKEIKGLQNLTNLQDLNLQNNQIGEIKGLEHLTNLQEINLEGNPIRAKERAIAFTQKMHVDVGKVNVTRNAQKIVRYCRDKKEEKIPFVAFRGAKFYVINEGLNLSGIGITDIAEIEGLEHFTNLNGLYLNRNYITEIKGLDKFTNLQYLDLSDNQIEEIKGLEKLENLRKISLWRNPIRTDEWDLVGRSAQELVTYCRDKKEGKLLYVTVNGTKYNVLNNTLALCGLGIKDITEIEGLEKLSTLKILWLSGNQIEEIRGLDHFPKLKELNLSQNRIKEINGLDRFTELQILSLSWNQIKEINGFNQLLLLKKLDLSNNQIEEVKGLEHFINLQELDLSHNPIRKEERYLFPGSAKEFVEYSLDKAKDPDFKPVRNAWIRCYKCRRPITRNEKVEVYDGEKVGEEYEGEHIIRTICKECSEEW